MVIGFLPMACFLCGWVAGEIDVEFYAGPEPDEVRGFRVLRSPVADKREIAGAEALHAGACGDLSALDVDELHDAVHGPELCGRAAGGPKNRPICPIL
jgi:hypothetical protein